MLRISTIVVTFLLIFIPAGMVRAQELPLEDYFFSFPQCYGRAYLPASAKPKQTVAEIAISHFPSRQELLGLDGQWQPYPDTPKFAAKIELSFFGHNPIHEPQWAWSTDAICEPEGDRLKCSIECDGGHFFLQSHAEGLLLTDGSSLDFNRCDFGDKILKRQTENMTFLLYPIPISHCTPK